jgi:branched-chain amino acid transport system substrate-binding protein
MTTAPTSSRHNRRKFLQFGAFAGAGSLAVPMLAKEARAEGEPIIVGAAVPLTGWAAADGLEIKQGLEMAWEEVNASGGILGRPVQLVIEDTKDMGGENVTSAIQRLIDRQGAQAIVNGYNTGALTAEYDLVADAGICYVHHNTDIVHHTTYASDPERYFGIFMADPAEYWYGEGLLKYLNGLIESGAWTPAEKTIAVVSGSQNYSVVIADAIRQKAQEYGWTITVDETVVVPISEWGPTLAKIRATPPAVIANTHFLPQDLAQFMLQFTPDPTDSLIYMQYGPSLSAFREIGGASTNGVLYSTVIATLQDAKGQDFSARYRAKYGEKASPLTAGMPYDSVHSFAMAAAMAGGVGAQGDFEQNKRVAERLRNLIYRGVQGVTRYDPPTQACVTFPTQTNDPSLGMPHQYLQIQDYTQEPKLIAPAPYQTASFVLPPWMAS